MRLAALCFPLGGSSRIFLVTTVMVISLVPVEKYTQGEELTTLITMSNAKPEYSPLQTEESVSTVNSMVIRSETGAAISEFSSLMSTPQQKTDVHSRLATGEEIPTVISLLPNSETAAATSVLDALLPTLDQQTDVNSLQVTSEKLPTVISLVPTSETAATTLELRKLMSTPEQQTDVDSLQVSAEKLSTVVRILPTLQASETEEPIDLLEETASTVRSISKLDATTTATLPNVTCRDVTANRTLSLRKYPLGAVVNASCAPGKPLIAWRCTAISAIEAEWKFEREYNCTEIKELEQLLKINLTYDSVSAILKTVANVTTEAGARFGVAVANVDATSRILNKAIQMATDRREMINLTEVVSETSTIIDRILAAPTESVAMSCAASNVSQNLEILLKASADTLEANTTMRFVEDNFYAQVTSDPEVIGLEITSDGVLSDNTVTPIRAGSVALNEEAEAQIYFASATKEIRKTFAVYNNFKLFNGKEMFPAFEMVLSAQLSRAVVHDELVTMHFKLPSGYKMEDSGNVFCGFWNYDDNDWSTIGCTRKSSVPSRVVCSCNHTTNFAVLMRFSKRVTDKVHQQVLSVITRVGLSVSICLLLVVIISYILFRRLRKRMTQKVHFNMSLSILLLDVAFLAGIERIESREMCIAFAALLHLFLLASFAWMSAEATLQYLRFVKVIVAVPHKFHFYAALPAWGLPIIITAVILIIDRDLYDTRNQGLCWVKPDVLYYAVFPPISLSILFNGIMFAHITKTLMASEAISMITNQSKSRRRKTYLRGCFSVFVLMGLTWVFAYFAIDKAELVFHYLFCIFNSAQGAAVAIFHGLTVKIMWREWRRMLLNRPYGELASAGTSYRSNSTSATSAGSHQASTRL